MTEAGRCDGGAASTYTEGMVGSPCIQLGSFTCPVDYEEEMHAAYVTSRLPSHCANASCVRIRKLNSVAGWAKHAIFHEYTSVDSFTRDYPVANAKSPLGMGGHVMVDHLVHAPSGPDSAVRLNTVARRLNMRPRKTLGYDTPANRLATSVASTP